MAIEEYNGNVEIQSGIVVGNAAGGCYAYGVIASQGYSVLQSGNGCPTAANDLTVTTAAEVIEPLLADHGGLTLTHALVTTGVAVNNHLDGSCLTTEDQRQYARPAGFLCDAGAFGFLAAVVAAQPWVPSAHAQ